MEPPSGDATPAIVPVSRRDWTQIDNPASDGWSSEVFSEDAGRVLSKIGAALTRPEPIDPAALSSLVTGDFVCGAFTPPALTTVFEDSLVRVDRGMCPPASDLALSEEDRGEAANRLARALESIRSSFPASTEMHYKFKLFDVQPSGEQYATRAYFALSGRTDQGRWEQNATWNIHFTPAKEPGESLPTIQSVNVADYERVVRLDGSETWFQDCTESILGSNPCFASQFLYGLNHWLGRIQDTRYFSSLGNPGLAVGDVNGDGLDDLYVCQESHLPNRLFLQNADGTATDVSAAWGVDWLENSRGVLLIDLDNDGDQDLAVSVLGGIVLAENERQQRFRVRTVLPTDDDTMSLTAVDYDNDGDLDLYQCVDYPNDFFASNLSLSSLGGTSNRVYHDSNNAGANALFRNDIEDSHDWRFTDVTEQVGLNVHNRRFSLAAAWDDYDNDGDQDLYVANDFGRNNLYRNDDAPDEETPHADDSPTWPTRRIPRTARRGCRRPGATTTATGEWTSTWRICFRPRAAASPGNRASSRLRKGKSATACGDSPAATRC